MSSSQHLVDDNNSCSIDISFFILSRHNPSILYFFIGIGNTLCSISAVTGNAIILLALRRCSLLHFSSKALFFSLALSDFAVGLVSQPLYAAYTFAVAWNQCQTLLHCWTTSHFVYYLSGSCVFLDTNGGGSRQISCFESSNKVPFDCVFQTSEPSYYNRLVFLSLLNSFSIL